MALFTHGHQPNVDLDLPIDEAASPSVAPASPSTTPSEETLPANQTTTRPIGSSFSDLGATFNGMARPPMDASPQSAPDQGGQGAGIISQHTNVLTTVQNNVLAELNTGQFSGAALGHVQAILSDITTAISAANASGSGGGMPGAEQALRASQLSIINTVNTDPVLANPAPQNGVTEPIAAPEAVRAGTTAATAPDANSEETTNLAEAGDAENAAQIDENLDAAIAELEALIAANPDLFVGLTADDADEIVHQIQLELSHINNGDVPLGAAQDSSGDITDIVTGDINLASMTAQGQPNSPAQQAVNIAGASETQASPQVATIAIGDVPVAIVTTEAPRSSSITAIRARPN
ncbi:hypothetical protein ACF1BQ_000920 [Bradyrhizobium sp. RDT10]